MKKKEIWLLILILVVAAFFRFYLIGKMPGGLFPDEAADGLDVNNIFKGHLLPFYARGNGREALFQYLLAISVHFFGRGFWQHHIVSALIGLLSVWTAFLLTKRLYGTKTALVASFLMAVSTWHIVLSRTAFRAIMIPLFTSLVFYFIVRFFQAKSEKEKIWSSIFVGIFFAGGFYTYIVYRAMVLILGAMALFLLIADRKQNFAWFKNIRKYLAYALISAFIIFLPLGIYFAKDPGSFLGRASQVSVFNTDLNHGHLLATVGDVAFKTMRSFFADGDTNWRQNISGQPFLSPFVSPFFGIALIVLTVLTIRFLWKCFSGRQDMQDLKHTIPVLLFWGMLLPEISTAEGIPHGLRLIGTIPAVFMISAVGLIYLVKLVLELWHYKWMEYIYVFVAIFFLASIAYLAYTNYFVYAYNNVDNAYAFRSDLSSVSDYINQNSAKFNKSHTFLVLDLFSLQTVDYFTTTSHNPYTVIDPANSWKLHPDQNDVLIFTASTIPDYLNFANKHPSQFEVLNVIQSRLGEVDMIAIKFTGKYKSPSLVSTGNPGTDSFTIVNFGDRIDFSWDNLQFDPWIMKIWQCTDAQCKTKALIKQENQNDYLANQDHIELNATKSDLYFIEEADDAKTGKVLKYYPTLKLPKYVQE